MAKRFTTDEFIKRAREVHGDKYDYGLVEIVGGKIKIKITCKVHGVFEQLPYNHLKGFGCSKCSGMNKKTTETFIKEAREIHGDKYDYSLSEYKSAKTKLKIICPYHGIFEQTPNNHIHGSYGCQECSSGRVFDRDRFIEEARKVHGDEYGYDDLIFMNFLTKVKVKCFKHGIFEVYPQNHLRGHKCLKCSDTTKTTEIFIKEAIKIHGDRYDYSETEYINKRTKLKIICKDHGEFLQSPQNHLLGYGCIKCSKKVSIKSQDWLDSLNNNNITREKYININGKRFFVDGYDKNTNTIYEFYGDFWHGNLNIFNSNDTNPVMKKTYGELNKITIKRNNLFKCAGYNIISIWESDWEKIK